MLIYVVFLLFKGKIQLHVSSFYFNYEKTVRSAAYWLTEGFHLKKIDIAYLIHFNYILIES